ncbi:MAG: acyl-ACP desaturase [Nocardioidaceae bacterium]|nr:acyl-ACP desaturase [Nocardioidaceae bacterium]
MAASRGAARTATRVAPWSYRRPEPDEGVRVSTASHLLEALEPVVAENLDRHLGMAQEWHPHDYIPWSEGRDFAFLGGEDWAPEQSRLSETAKAAMITNLLTEDNLPSYHREIAARFGRDGAWGTWVGRWTAEENRHGIVMRDYLVVTRGVDPVELERARMAYMTSGYESGDKTLLQAVAYVSFQELATRVSHRNTGKVTRDPVADRMLARISKDENLHMVFYRNLVAAALEIAPDEAMRAIADEVIGFEMPGATMTGFRRNSMIIARAGIYDLRLHHEDVLMPILRHWDVFDRTDLGAVGEQAREELATFLQDLDTQAARFVERRSEQRARAAARADSDATPDIAS